MVPDGDVDDIDVHWSIINKLSTQSLTRSRLGRPDKGRIRI
jgi:hypothetical protein